MVKPISPTEVHLKIPDGILEAFDDMIKAKWNGYEAYFTLTEVADTVGNYGIDKAEAFKKKWFDVEVLYRTAGWEVEYRNQAYRDEYPSSFTFRKK